MNPFLLIFTVFMMFVIMGSAMAMAGIFLFQYLQPEPNLIQTRLSRLKSHHLSVQQTDFVEHQIDLSALFKQTKFANQKLGKFIQKFSVVNHLKHLLHKSGDNTPLDAFIIMRFVVPAGAGLLLTLILHTPAALLIGLLVPAGSVFLLHLKKKAKFNKFTEQLPDAISLITSSLRAGYTFQSALQCVANDLSPPVSIEFAQVVNDINLGIPVKKALDKMVMNLELLPDVKMFTTAVLIQREAGGNLAEILDKLAFTIRERFKLKRQLSALTAQSRLTGYVLGCAPFGLLLGLTLLSYNYVKPLYTTPLGNIMLLVALVMMIIGFVVMKKIVQIRV
jgi:tight adherence protein B